MRVRPSTRREFLQRAIAVEDAKTGEGWQIWAKGCPNPFDGAGTGAKRSADNIAAGWMPLAQWDEKIFKSVKENYANRALPQPDKAVALLMGIAHLNHFAQRRKR